MTVTRTANISPLNQPRMYVALVLPCRRNNERDSRIARTGDSGCSLHSQPPAGAWGRAERVVAYILQQHSQEKTSCYSILSVRCWWLEEARVTCNNVQHTWWTILFSSSPEAFPSAPAGHQSGLVRWSSFQVEIQNEVRHTHIHRVSLAGQTSSQTEL